MKRLKTEFNALVNRGVDRHLRLAVTGLSRSGKTAFITALVNQLLNIHAGARLPLLSAAREERLLGVKRVPQRDFGIPRFTYDEGLAQLYGQPPVWPTPTRGVSEIRLALRYRSNDSLLRHFKETSTLYLEIVDYPGEWLLDLPMLAQDYLTWSRQMTGLLQGQRAAWSARWRQLCEGLDPLAPADETRLAEIAAGFGIEVGGCGDPALDEAGLAGEGCIDAAHVEQVAGVVAARGRGSRRQGACRCAPSVDVGSYDTCANGCVYCYANPGANGGAPWRLSRYDPEAPMLCDEVRPGDTVAERSLHLLPKAAERLF